MKIFPAVRRTVIFDVDFLIFICGQNGHCVNRTPVYIASIHTHSHIRIFVGRSANKRHFFRCYANKVIWHLEAIRRAVIFDVDFVINAVRTVTA